VRTGWDGASTDPAAPIKRIGMIAIVVALVGLPWMTRPRRVFGPAANSWARLVRGGAYAALWIVPLVGRDLSRFAGARFDGHTSPAERVNSAVVG
jgi:hypothetical protein